MHYTLTNPTTSSGRGIYGFRGWVGASPQISKDFLFGGWGIPPALFYSEVVFDMLLNTVFDLMNIINNYSSYHGVSEKSQIDHLHI